MGQSDRDRSIVTNGQSGWSLDTNGIVRLRPVHSHQWTVRPVPSLQWTVGQVPSHVRQVLHPPQWTVGQVTTQWTVRAHPPMDSRTGPHPMGPPTNGHSVKSPSHQWTVRPVPIRSDWSPATIGQSGQSPATNGQSGQSPAGQTGPQPPLDSQASPQPPMDSQTGPPATNGQSEWSTITSIHLYWPYHS